MKSSPILSPEAFLQRLKTRRGDGPYYAMYSSWAGGIVTDPALMLVPIDDHLVHRGDGVFETLKCVEGALYNFQAHLDRLERSAGALDLAIPESLHRVSEHIVQTVRAGGVKNCAVRVIVSRGPGSLGVNPYDSPRTQLYVVAAELPPSFMDAHPGGARAGRTAVPVKPPPLADIKTCNYLSNVLMKKEAVDRALDFVIAFDEDGYLSEGAVENVALVDANRLLLTPSGTRLLKGTTLKRIQEFAEAIGNREVIGGLEERPLSVDDIAHAREVLLLGTTIDVVAVVEFEGRPVGDGKPGPAYAHLSARLKEDLLHDRTRRTIVF